MKGEAMAHSNVDGKEAEIKGSEVDNRRLFKAEAGWGRGGPRPDRQAMGSRHQPGCDALERAACAGARSALRQGTTESLMGGPLTIV
jgi:hypothetical protein